MSWVKPALAPRLERWLCVAAKGWMLFKGDELLSGSSGIGGVPDWALGREAGRVADEVGLPPISSAVLDLLSLCLSWSGAMDEDVSNTN